MSDHANTAHGHRDTSPHDPGPRDTQPQTTTHQTHTASTHAKHAAERNRPTHNELQTQILPTPLNELQNPFLPPPPLSSSPTTSIPSSLPTPRSAGGCTTLDPATTLPPELPHVVAPAGAALSPTEPHTTSTTHSSRGDDAQRGVVDDAAASQRAMPDADVFTGNQQQGAGGSAGSVCFSAGVASATVRSVGPAGRGMPSLTSPAPPHAGNPIAEPAAASPATSASRTTGDIAPARAKNTIIFSRNTGNTTSAAPNAPPTTRTTMTPRSNAGAPSMATAFATTNARNSTAPSAAPRGPAPVVVTIRAQGASGVGGAGRDVANAAAAGSAARGGASIAVPTTFSAPTIRAAAAGNNTAAASTGSRTLGYAAAAAAGASRSVTGASGGCDDGDAGAMDVDGRCPDLSVGADSDGPSDGSVVGYVDSSPPGGDPVMIVPKPGVTIAATGAALRRALKEVQLTAEERASIQDTAGSARYLAGASVETVDKQRAEELAKCFNLSIAGSKACDLSLLGLASVDPDVSSSSTTLRIRPPLRRSGERWVCAVQGTDPKVCWPMTLHQHLVDLQLVRPEGATIEYADPRLPWLSCLVPRGGYASFRRWCHEQRVIIRKGDDPKMWAVHFPASTNVRINAQRARAVKHAIAIPDSLWNVPEPATQDDVSILRMTFEADDAYSPATRSFAFADAEGRFEAKIVSPMAFEHATRVNAHVDSAPQRSSQAPRRTAAAAAVTLKAIPQQHVREADFPPLPATSQVNDTVAPTRKRPRPNATRSPPREQPPTPNQRGDAARNTSSTDTSTNGRTANANVGVSEGGDGRGMAHVDNGSSASAGERCDDRTNVASAATLQSSLTPRDPPLAAPPQPTTTTIPSASLSTPAQTPSPPPATVPQMSIRPRTPIVPAAEVVTHVEQTVSPPAANVTMNVDDGHSDTDDAHEQARSARGGFYAIAYGIGAPCIHTTWSATHDATNKVKGARHKWFATRDAAQAWIDETRRKTSDGGTGTTPRGPRTAGGRSTQRRVNVD